MKPSILIIICLLSFSSFAKGLMGNYIISGKAYNSIGKPICNGEIILQFNDKSQIIKTDSLGNYYFEVNYETVCPSEVKGIKRRKANNMLNPKFILLEFENETVKIKNKWRKFESKKRQELNLYFE